ncbi:MAG TPA: Sua5/YciO/YrdC/YwlC family protein [Burkholderiales bacterium]|nr:Sua5/YciO/YrdC/YwlC family protein [Burkholderiales bacterium]
MRRLRAHVSNGGLIAYATASCFGIGCDPRNPRAIQKLLRIKGRPRHKGLILIAHDFKHLAPFVARLTESEQKKAKEKWPGPHTWLMRASSKTSRFVRGRRPNVAVRVDAHPDAVMVCRVLNSAIISTSLNRAGCAPVRTYREALRQFSSRVMVLPGRIGRNKTPSTIQDFSTRRIFRK